VLLGLAVESVVVLWRRDRSGVTGRTIIIIITIVLPGQTCRQCETFRIETVDDVEDVLEFNGHVSTSSSIEETSS
jgi:hypothetical protein